MASLIGHLEDYLGDIDSVWQDSPDGAKLPFTVARFGLVFDERRAYATIGLSRIPLQSVESKKLIRQEFLLLAPDDFGDRNIPGVLQDAASLILKRGAPALRGEVVEGPHKMFDGYSFTSLYVAIPVYLPEEFAEATDDEKNPVVIAWLVPITTPEAEYVKQHGWSKFEDLLVEQDPDLADFDRRPLL